MSDKDVCLWSPSASKHYDGTTQMTLFRQYIEKKYDITLSTYAALHKWSVDQIGPFWESVWEHCGIVSSVPYHTVYEKEVSMDKVPKFFIGAKLNFTENILLKRVGNRPALIDVCEQWEQKGVDGITDDQLVEQVRICQRALHKLGLVQGDCIAGYLPNTSKAVILFLAAASLGIIWTCASPDLGVHCCLDRFEQVKPKVLFSVSKVFYNGKVRELGSKVYELAEGLDSLRAVVFIDDLTDLLPGFFNWSNFKSLDDGAPICYEQLSFSYPLVILYSSGTTGAPKCIVHTAGGVLIQHMKEHIIHGNVSADDVFFYYTTTGWMMWNWLVSALGTGCTVVLYDGSPFCPTAASLWKLTDKLSISVFGTSAKYIGTLRDFGLKPKEFSKLQNLRMIFSTGSPLSPDNFDYVYENIKSDVILASITGGTDIVSLFAGHNTDLPVYRGKLQCITLGMAVEAWNGQGMRVFDVAGDLVCVAPFPVMPLCFLNDESGDLYRKAYFSGFKNVWTHGDFITVSSSDGTVSVLGRSDGTLNPNGIRFGPADLYNIMDGFKEVEDSLAVGQIGPGGEERVILFCKMASGVSLSSELLLRIKSTIREKLSARHVPELIFSVPDIPYTMNGKKVEVVVKRILSGGEVLNGSVLANPECLDYFRNLYRQMCSKL